MGITGNAKRRRQMTKSVGHGYMGGGRFEALPSNVHAGGEREKMEQQGGQVRVHIGQKGVYSP